MQTRTEILICVCDKKIQKCETVLVFVNKLQGTQGKEP